MRFVERELRRWQSDVGSGRNGFSSIGPDPRMWIVYSCASATVFILRIYMESGGVNAFRNLRPARTVSNNLQSASRDGSSSDPSTS
jgi:hypothetical protein